MFGIFTFIVCLDLQPARWVKKHLLFCTVINFLPFNTSNVVVVTENVLYVLYVNDKNKSKSKCSSV